MDFLGMMKQAAQLQSKMQALQEELDRTEVEGQAGGGLVAVRLSAKGDMKGGRIDPSLCKPEEIALSLQKFLPKSMRPGGESMQLKPSSSHRYIPKCAPGGEIISMALTPSRMAIITA